MERNMEIVKTTIDLNGENMEIVRRNEEHIVIID